MADTLRKDEFDAPQRPGGHIGGGLHLEHIAAVVVDEAYHIHAELGPGLLESVYQKILAAALQQRGLSVATEVPVSFSCRGMAFDAELRLDLLVGDSLVVELKSTETTLPVHKKQLLTYLRLTRRPIGLLINFGLSTFKEGCSRVVNHYDEKLAPARPDASLCAFASSRGS